MEDNTDRKIEYLMLETPEMVKAKEEIFENLFLYGQCAIHYPSLTVGIDIEEVEEKLKNDSSNRK